MSVLEKGGKSERWDDNKHMRTPAMTPEMLPTRPATMGMASAIQWRRKTHAATAPHTRKIDVKPMKFQNMSATKMARKCVRGGENVTIWPNVLFTSSPAVNAASTTPANPSMTVILRDEKQQADC